MSRIRRRDFIKKSSAAIMMPYFLDSQERTDLILYNAKVITMNSSTPVARAIAISGNHFVGVGSNDDIQNLKNAGTRMIDLGGSTVLPGFIDSHCHFASSGRAHLFNVDCDLRSITAIQDALRKRVKETPKGEWIYGFKYDDTKTKEKRFVSMKDLDEVSTEHPIIIRHRGGHTSYANTMAFKKAGVDENTPDPPGGHYGRADGKLTGRILEKASAPFYKDAPDPSKEDYVRGVKLMSEKLAISGITSVHEAGGSPADLEAYQKAYERGQLKTRTYCSIRHHHMDKMIEAGIKTGLGDDWVKVGFMKTGCDGSISERTAWLSQPYIGRPDDFGIQTASREELYDICRKAHLAGWQIGVHANGDRAIDMTLGVYEQLQKENARTDPRFRLEHCTVINEGLVKRIADLDAIPNPFSTYVYFHGEKMKEYGEERLNSMFALKSFLDAGIKVTQTSDYPPGPFEPMMALQSSATRTDYTGKTWGSSQKVTVEEAIKIGTLHGAHASYDENKKGSITPGKLADLVVLEDDPTTMDPSTIIDNKVERTMADGKWIYES